MNDAPKRLLELSPPPDSQRTVPVQAWSAVVYVAGSDDETAR